MLRRSFAPSIIIAVATATPLARGQLSYVDLSTGLQTPQMEGGNTELEFGDVNADGHVDIVSVGDHGSPFINTSEHGIMVWFGDGAGTWSVFQTGNFGYGGIALGDVNNDGLMDVGYGVHHDYSSTDFGDQILEVALGYGTGTRWTPWDDGLATNGETWGMFGTDFADVDNDGDLDVGSISFGCCAGLHVYLNNGDGTWTQSFGFVGGNSNMIFQFGDVSGDGLADFAASHGYGTVYQGDGAGGFTLIDGNLPTSSYGLNGISLGDVNGDGIDDLAFAYNGGLQVWTLSGPGVWSNLSGNLPAGGDFEFAQIADMNLDGHGDIAALAGGSSDLVAVFAGDGAGTWQQVASQSVPDNCGLAAFRGGTDADHNGYPDMAFVIEQGCSWPTDGINTPHCYAESSTPSATWIHAKAPRGGETFAAGSVRFLEWHAAEVGSPTYDVMIELSRNGPDCLWTPVATGVPDNGRFQWALPTGLPASDACYLRYTLNEAAAVAGPFTILSNATSEPGDLDCDSMVGLGDIDAFVLAVTDPDAYVAIYRDCDLARADINDDCSIDGRDIGPFVAVLVAP